MTDRYEEALKYLERLEALGQDNAWTNTEFGYCLSKLGRSTQIGRASCRERV